MEEECSRMLSKFFSAVRTRKKTGQNNVDTEEPLLNQKVLQEK
jgi:hypothetical protein